MPAQEMLGIVNSSYSGITGSVFNPAVTVTSPYYLDVNIIAGDVFFENNYMYLAKEEYRFSRFFSKNPDYPTHGITDNSMIAYDYYNTKDKSAFTSERILGPSVAVTVGRHSFGIVTGARIVMSTRNVPYDVAKFVFEKLEYPPQYDINYKHTKDIYNAELAWSEVGFNYSYVIKQQSTDYWAGGITVKSLQGYAGGYIYGNYEDYYVKDSMVYINSFIGETGYSLPLNYETNEFSNHPLFRGKGMGIDIGVIYEKKKSDPNQQTSGKLCSQSYVPYKYKIGLSILDIGRIRFTENAEKLVFGGVPVNWQPTTGYSVYSVRDITDTLSQMFYGNKTDLIQGNEITIALPTAISIQADVNVKNNWFINGTFVGPLQFSKSGLRRPVLIGLTPRYQTARWEASLPITLYDLSKFRIGLSARYRGFFIGTEKISGFFHYRDFTGLDFYAGLKFSLSKGNCRNKKAENCGIEEYKIFRK